VGLIHMMAAQRDLQRKMGYDIPNMTQTERIAYIHENATNVLAEIVEALGEVDWKSWVNTKNIHEERCFGELRDAWQCLTNMMFAVLPNYDDVALANLLEAKLIEKHRVNIARIEAGYDGRTNKCPECKRALDDADVECMKSAAGYHCAVTGVTTYTS